MSGGARPMVDPSLDDWLRRLRADLDAHRCLVAAGDPLASGALIAAAHQVLSLSVIVLTSAHERQRRRTELDSALSELADAGLDHLGALVAAALIHDGCPASSTAEPERLQ